MFCTHDQQSLQQTLDWGQHIARCPLRQPGMLCGSEGMVSTLMVQSVEPEKRRRSSNMARHTTAPVWPVSRCSSHTPLPIPPSSPPLTAVQLDSSNSARLPVTTYNCKSRKETAMMPLMIVQILCCCCCCCLYKCQGIKGDARLGACASCWP